MKLTIGMIVKNEEKRLEKCLDAIKPILDRSDSELIITDTGSTDNTVQIASRYTDKILRFNWCDDFSAARNTAFETARGEWFMFVDADDVFAKYDDLIGFFNSGECDKYGSASFTYRNIRSEDKSDYLDQYVIRIVRRFPQTKFVGRIHEVLDPMPEPIKKLDTIVEHYGYLYDSNNNADAKMKRNEGILQRELNETPASDGKSVLLYYYLYEEVRDHESEEAEQYLNTGIETAYKLKSERIIPLIHEKARIYLSRGYNEAALKLCEEYFSLDTEMRAGEICADTEMYAVKAVALMQLGRFDEATKAFPEFFRLFDLVNSGKLVTGDRYIYLPALSGDGELPNMIARFIDCCDRCGNISEVEKFIRTYPVSKYIRPERQADLFYGIYILIKNGSDISPLFLGSEEQTILSASLCCDNISGFFETAGAYSVNSISNSDKLPDIALFYEACINKALQKSADTDALIYRFTEIGEAYSSNVENASIKLSRVIAQAEKYRKNGNYKECFAVLKAALREHQRAAELIKAYIDIVSAEMNGRGTNSSSSELDRLAAMLKNNIRKLIASGKFPEAKSYLDEYVKIKPGDPEIDELRNMMK